MGFNPCKAEPDIWMRDQGQDWEYIRMYVDDLAIASKDPLALTGSLETKYGFSLNVLAQSHTTWVVTSFEMEAEYSASNQRSTSKRW